jgi:hypothetical protein
MRNTATLGAVLVGVAFVAVANAAGPLRGDKSTLSEVTLVRTDQDGLASVRLINKAKLPVHHLQAIVTYLKEFGFVIVRGRVTAEKGRTCTVAINPDDEGRRYSVGCQPNGAAVSESHDTAADAVWSVKSFVRGESRMGGTVSRRSWPMIVG